MSSQADSSDLFWDTDTREDASSTTSLTETVSHSDPAKQDAGLSLFESVFTAYPTFVESLLAQIPTPAVLDLYHTSRTLRKFLREYPLAWKTLSFRLPQPAAVVGSPGNETPDGRERQSKTYSFDALLKQVIQPYGTRLTSLDLCNTAVSGIALVGSVLAPRINTLQHLSVRGCKNVSIKYHIVPFLEPYTLKDSPWLQKDLALRSLYTYRCRHHRRRPYLPSSLVRRDSDSDPTHQLIEICHQLGIWTDTAWCPTPGGRCYRRKDYHAGRAGPQNMEVWVPFDRLWRSSNRLGSGDGRSKLGATDGRLWEIAETGQDGEPLGTENGIFKGEGKHVPAHLRKSHNMFIEDIKCAQCNEVILERCESCSVRMHCMGCRKTLCASCAFNRPIPRKRVKTRHFANLAFGPSATLGSTIGHASGSSSSLQEQNRTPRPQPTNRFWWAPGATRSPNLMNESAHDEDSSDSEDGGNMNAGLPLPPANREPPKLNMHWCCLEPIFSGGGGIAVLGTGLGGKGADKIRAAPLPRTKEFEDPDFSNQLRPVDYVRELKNNGLYEYVLGEDVDLISYLKQDSLDLQAETCPRGLCQDCYRSFRWKVSCRSCKSPLCKEHDFRGLKFRKCGYRDMHTERDYVRSHNEPPRLLIPEFNPNSRTPCPAILKECSECAVLVCDVQACNANNPTCTCTFCTVNFHCPSCSRKKEIKAQCRLEEEVRAKKEAELRAIEKLERDKEERGQANELAEAVYEFWSHLLGEVTDEIINGANFDGQLELPVPSPDSITVTTEFGVVQEPNHFTVITASGPPASSVYEEDEEEDVDEDQVEHVEHLDMPLLTTGPPVIIVEHPEDMADDEGDDLEFDEDDMDAEGDLIDEFIDDGALTPTTATTV
ncbi:hypothetical protein BDV96DRAFT_491716 [Lophiotrema nucula]|uniref:Uncharacterized protein n=1 Tax=Lophiotrema nucula TaxID=690887 RepID=A0A6A5ZB76_9PLEO|nr:hypothetical protein BDV96DRAFT_491716 [Lophiotrema nucula]